MIFGETLSALKALTDALTSLSQKKTERRNLHAKRHLFELYRNIVELEKVGQEIVRQAEELIKHDTLHDPSRAQENIDRWYKQLASLRETLMTEKFFTELLGIYDPKFMESASRTLDSCDGLMLSTKDLKIEKLLARMKTIQHEFSIRISYQQLLGDTTSADKLDADTRARLLQDVKTMLRDGRRSLRQLDDAKIALREFISTTYSFEEMLSL